MNTGINLAACIAATALMGAASNAQQVIYDNSVNNQAPQGGDPAGTIYVSNQGSMEIGDLVSFSGSARTLTDFQFEYFVNPSGNESIQVFIRSLDGPGNSPGSVLYDSGALDLAAMTGGANSADYYQFRATGLSLELPERVAWTVAFNGFETTEGGLLFYGAPEVGTSPRFDPGSGTVSEGPGSQDFYYRKSQLAGWEIVTQGDLVENFAARFTAVPEPSAFALIAGGLAAFGLMRRKKA